MPIPQSLSRRINLFRETGRIFIKPGELFLIDSWLQVMMSQGIVPKQYHPIVNTVELEELQRFLQAYKATVEQEVSKLPMHGDFLKEYCPTEI